MQVVRAGAALHWAVLLQWGELGHRVCAWDGARKNRAGFGCPVRTMQCLPVLSLALHRADVTWFVSHYALCDNYKNVKIELAVPSRQHAALSGAMCVFLLPLRG